MAKTRIKLKNGIEGFLIAQHVLEILFFLIKKII